MTSIAALLSLLFFSPTNFVADGYSYPLSVLPGDSLNVYLNGESSSDYKVKLYDMAGKVVAEYSTKLFPQTMAGDKPWETGYGYKPTLKLVTPDLPSGVYVWENKIPLIIRAVNPKIVIVYSSNTENAYCNAGGKGLYAYNSSDNITSPAVSFKRPINLPKHSESFYRWFKKQNVKGVGYVTDADLDFYHNFKRAKLLIIAGHSEYWTLEARRNFDKFVNEGKDVMVLSGNTMWWQVRYNSKRDQLICHKDVKERPDPIKNPLLKTINWDKPLLEYSIISSIGADFPRAGYGVKQDSGWDGFKILKASPLFDGTSLKKGDILPLPSDESDGVPITGLDEKGVPIPDMKMLGFYKLEIVGFDRVFRVKEGYGTWIVFKKTKYSGTIINVATTDWCSSRGMDNEKIQKITMNMINKLLARQEVFSPEEPPKSVKP